MHPSKDMERIVGGKRYAVRTANLIASDEYYDGQNFERNGRNKFLYRTKGGAYFEVRLTQWTGESDDIIPLSREEAIELWDDLQEKEVSYESAFDAVVEDAALGRPTYYGAPMRQTAIWLPEDMIAWLKLNPDGLGAKVRSMIAQAMAAKAE